MLLHYKQKFFTVIIAVVIRNFDYEEPAFLLTEKQVIAFSFENNVQSMVANSEP